MRPRLLVIDDDAIIHELFEAILSPEPSSRDAALLAAAELLGVSPSASSTPQAEFDVDHAHSGKAGYEAVLRAVDAGTPYAVAFIDVRMEPGWGGFDIIPLIREVDTDLQIVVCTAYGDPGDDEWERVGFEDATFLLKKPFDPAEVRRFAKSLVARRNRLTDTRNQLAAYAAEIAALKAHAATEGR